MKEHPIPFVLGILFVWLPLLCSSCGRFQGGSTTAPESTRGLPAEDAVARVPVGQVAGAPTLSVVSLSIANPHQDNPQAIKQGHELFIKMNCAGCHGYNGKGNMGPDLSDTYWRYGGLPVQIYMSIRDGRSNGMPAWGVALPSDDFWKLVSFVQSLGGSVPVADYRHARQGDRAGEQVSPNAQGNAQQDSPPPIVTLPTIAPLPSTPGSVERPNPSTPLKSGAPPL
ncbi:MAG: c-type cytochrome [Bryobacteraceae bacterium]